MTYKPKPESHPPADPETSSHIPIRPLYTPGDLNARDQEREVGYPGDYPFTRGVQATVYRGRLWTMRQYAGMGDAEESNKRYKYLLANGTTGLSVAFDLPTQIGMDSDHPLAVGEVGKVGVAIDSIEDMQRLFDGIDLTKISTSMTINATASVLLALYVAVARRQGADIRQLSGTVQNDVLKEYISRGTYIYPPAQAMRIITDLFAWTNQNVPEWNTISISGYHMREAGSTAVQEVAFTLGNGIAYVQAAINAGLDVDEFAPRISFFFNAHNNFLEEVAKFRAARRMWARIMREHFKAQSAQFLTAFSLGGYELIVKFADLFGFEKRIVATNHRHLFAYCADSLSRWRPPAFFSALSLSSPQLTHNIVASHEPVVSKALSECHSSHIVDAFDRCLDPASRFHRLAHRCPVEINVILDLQPANFKFQLIKVMVNGIFYLLFH